jgi:hypothetical protein
MANRVVCVIYESITMSTRLAQEFRAELLDLVGATRTKPSRVTTI